MKTNKFGRLVLCMVALATWMLGACDDTMEGATTLGFPTDTLIFVANPNDTVEVPFSVGFDWKISSNALWCTPAGSTSAYGTSGKHTVSFVVSDKGHKATDEKAEITLIRTSDGESRVIANITRLGKKGYAIELSGDNGVYAAGESIILGTSGSMKLHVKSNFNIELLNMSSPKWLKATRVSDTITLKVEEDSKKYTINNYGDSLVLFKNDSTFSRGFHVQYVGMDRWELSVKPQIEGTLIVSRDAKRCHVGDTEYTTPISFSVEALNDCYELVSVAYDEDKGCSMLAAKERWFDVDSVYGRPNEIRLSFADENEGDARTAYLLALPQAIVDSLAAVDEEYDVALADFLWEEIDSKAELKDEVKKFCVVKMAQDGVMDITISPEAQWNLRVATDGKTYKDALRGETFDAPVEATITTYRGYELICASYDSKKGCTLMEVQDSWLNITDDKQGHVKVRFKANTGNERVLYLFALPLPLVEELKSGSAAYHDNLSKELFDTVDGLFELNEKSEKFVIAKFVQDADEGNAIKVLMRGEKSIEVVRETDQAWLDAAALKGVPSNKVFRCSMELGYMYLINPLIPLDVWDPGSADTKGWIEIYGMSGKKYTLGRTDDDEFIGEYTMMEEQEGEHMLVQLTANGYDAGDDYLYYVTEDFIVYFIDSATGYLKALVVTLE